jgi:hypothetical protein
MFRRTFQGNAPHITFTRSWQQVPFGNLVPGQTVRISYDPHRLGFPPPPSVTAFHRFSRTGPVGAKQLDLPSGRIITRIADDPYEANFMTTAIEIPDDAEMLILWFMGESGPVLWDSAHGANYSFRFTSLDIQGEQATVTDGFQVSLTALPEVDNVTVHFKVINNPPGEPFEGNVPLLAGDVENGRRTWQNSGVAVPPEANIRFHFTYAVDGRTFTDDNDGTGFFAPKPPPLHDPRKYAAALRPVAPLPDGGERVPRSGG